MTSVLGGDDNEALSATDYVDIPVMPPRHVLNSIYSNPIKRR